MKQFGDHRELHVLTHSFPTRRSSDLFAFRKTNQAAKARAIPMKMCCARIPQAKGISSPANSSTVQKPMSSGSSSRWGTRYLSAIMPPSRRDRIRCSDDRGHDRGDDRSEEHTSELQSLMRISYAVFCLKQKKK